MNAKSIIRTAQKSDFSPVVYFIVDYRNVRTETSVEPVRKTDNVDSKVAYYTEQGYQVEVLDNDGSFGLNVKFFSQVYRLMKQTAEVVEFRNLYDATEFARKNYTAIMTAKF